MHDFWNQTGFDLWEEQSGSSHFTSAAQHRALRVGALFAKRLGHSDVAAQYTTQANNVLCFLQVSDLCIHRHGTNETEVVTELLVGIVHHLQYQPPELAHWTGRELAPYLDSQLRSVIPAERFPNRALSERIHMS